MEIIHRGREQAWHLYLMVCILVLAICTRFYALDQIGLSANELSVFASCGASSWLDMAARFSANSGMPPGYPTLLCGMTALMGQAELFIRLPSVLTGLGCIYLVYRLGRDFISPIAGLLAAAILATDFHAVLIDREASLYSLLTLLCLANSYSFCQLLLSQQQSGRPLYLAFSSRRSQLTWIWSPDSCPGPAEYLLAFWLTGMAALYTSYMSSILLVAEFAISIFILRRGAWPGGCRRCLQCLWLPIVIACLPWLTNLMGFRAWILAGNLFGLQSIGTVLQAFGSILSVNKSMRYVEIIMLVLALLFTGMLFLRKRQFVSQFKILAIIAVQLCVAILAIALIPTGSTTSYMYWFSVLLLLAVAPATIFIDLISVSVVKVILVTMIVIGISVFQIRKNSHSAIYVQGNREDFRRAVQIIHDDKEFMGGARITISNSNFFDYYLKKYNVIQSAIAEVNSSVPDVDISSLFENKEFYYLEYNPVDVGAQVITPAMQKLSGQYQILCMTYIPNIRIVKYSTGAAVSVKPPAECEQPASAALIAQQGGPI